ncbi:MAG: glycosyltransferase [Verrucomicrobiota bacterium]
MAWSPQLAARWPRHVFDARWDLLPSLAESASAFLRSLDLFVYSLHPSCRESWGRAVVEAMLSGAVPLVPAGEQHHLESLISPGETGFVCRTAADYGRYARQLENDPGRRSRLARQARAFAEKHLCNPAHHRDLWRRLFYGSALA